MPRIPTRDAQGKPNGWLQTLWHVDGGGPRIDQVYLTAILPGCQKGPHLHLKRRGLFTCIKGEAYIVWRDLKGNYHRTVPLGPSHCRQPIEIDPGCAAALYNTGPEEAWLLNMPSPPWRAEDQDEHPVEDWTYELQAVSV